MLKAEGSRGKIEKVIQRTMMMGKSDKLIGVERMGNYYLTQM
jgi:hypothetical protein